MTSPSHIELDPASADLGSLLGNLPATHGVYAIRSGTDALHLSSTSNLRRRLTRLLDQNRPSGVRLTQKIAEHSALVECWPSGSSLEAALQMYGLAMRFSPGDYAKHLRLRLPWFLSVTDDVFPRLTISNRLATGTDRPVAGAAIEVGPFASRELASRYEESVLPLFQVRRCSETLHPQLDHPGCVYGEMNLCLRPCQMNVSAEQYAAEIERLEHFLAAGPEVAMATLSLARDRAASQLDFEWAGQLHKQMERIGSCISARPEMAKDLQDFNGVALTPGLEPNSYHLRPLLQGFWHERMTFRVPEEANGNVSLDTALRELLEDDAAREICPGNRGEHLALFLRWHGSHSRVGEWFPFNGRQGFPYRKLARGVSRLAKSRGQCARV